MRFWDPIGVYGDVDAEDEYDRYLPLIIEILEKGGSEDELSRILLKIESVDMELRGDAESAKTCARALKALIRQH